MAGNHFKPAGLSTHTGWICCRCRIYLQGRGGLPLQRHQAYGSLLVRHPACITEWYHGVVCKRMQWKQWNGSEDFLKIPKVVGRDLKRATTASFQPQLWREKLQLGSRSVPQWCLLEPSLSAHLWYPWQSLKNLKVTQWRPPRSVSTGLNEMNTIPEHVERNEVMMAQAQMDASYSK